MAMHRKLRIGAMLLTVIAVLLASGFTMTLVLYLAETTEDSEQPTAFIYDTEGSDWNDGETISVFYNEEFGTAKVAPYSSGSYSFVFSNTSGYTLEYTIELSEVNEYDIAMCYKLKRDGVYVVDTYSRAGDFECSELTIVANSSHAFVLEWYWDGDVSDYNDTLAGSNAAIYTLTISISAVAATD